MTPADYRSALARHAADHAHATRTAADERRILDDRVEHHAAAVRGQKILQEVAAAVQEAAHAQISSVVSRCLTTIFGAGAYGFRIVFEQKRGKTEARLTFVRRDMEVDPTTAAGGGCVDVAAFGLRLAALLLARPVRRRLLILDEPFKALDDQAAARVGGLLDALAADLDIQIILVTHNGGLVPDGGHVVRLGGA